eukprot:3885560-Pyramimonas_sp.AAC.1
MQSLSQCETSCAISSRTSANANVNRPFCSITNSLYIASELKAELTTSSEFSSVFRECLQLDGGMHISALLSPRLHATVLRGLHEQLKADGKAYPFSIGTVCCEEPHFDFDEWCSEHEVFDDNAGAQLPTELVQEAMLKEMGEYKKHEV